MIALLRAHSSTTAHTQARRLSWEARHALTMSVTALDTTMSLSMSSIICPSSAAARSTCCRTAVTRNGQGCLRQVSR